MVFTFNGLGRRHLTKVTLEVERNNLYSRAFLNQYLGNMGFQKKSHCFLQCCIAKVSSCLFVLLLRWVGVGVGGLHVQKPMNRLYGSLHVQFSLETTVPQGRQWSHGLISHTWYSGQWRKQMPRGTFFNKINKFHASTWNSELGSGQKWTK